MFRKTTGCLRIDPLGPQLPSRICKILEAFSGRISRVRAAGVIAASIAICAVFISVTLTPAQSADSAKSAADKTSLRFEVAAIKPSPASPRPFDEWRSCPPAAGGTCRFINWRLKDWVEMGLSVSDYALKAPPWLEGSRFDLDAKIPGGGPFSQKDTNEMMRNLLVDRFALKWHEERATVSGYELVASKKVLLKPSDPSDPKSGGRSRGATLIAGTGMPMSDLATALGEVLGTPVVDDTQLSGGYDLKLIWRPDDEQAALAFAKALKMDVDDLPSSVFSALREQAGLRLERAQVPSRVTVVDSINRQPTEN